MSLPELYGIITPAGNMFGHSSSRGKAEQHAEQTGNTVVRYIPAPTWRPIAELPPEWRDGRLVRLGYSEDGNEYLCSWPGPDEPRAPGWYIWDGEDWTPLRVTPTHYLDLTIPEVPCG